jgi:hypothetical protein
MIKSNYPSHPNDFVQEEMNEHDKKMVDKAKELHYTDWMEVHEGDAETVVGFMALRSIASHLYHLEEAANGCL